MIIKTMVIFIATSALHNYVVIFYVSAIEPHFEIFRWILMFNKPDIDFCKVD